MDMDLDMDMRSAEAGCGQLCSVQRASQGCNSSDVGPRLNLDRSLILILLLLEGWRAWVFVPARAGQDRDLERQERGAFADMGKEHMGISAGGGLPISVPSSRAAFRPRGELPPPSHSFTPLPVYVCMCVSL